MIHVIMMGVSCLISLFSVIFIHLVFNVLVHPVVCILMIIACYISGLMGWEKGLKDREHKESEKDKKKGM